LFCTYFSPATYIILSKNFCIFPQLKYTDAMKIKIFLLITFFFLISTTNQAQNNYQIKQATGGKGLIYSREKVLALQMHTGGLAAAYQWGKLKSYNKTTFYQISLGYIKHSKETRSSFSPNSLPSGNAFVYGKQNNFLQFKISYGEKKYFTEKDISQGVAVGMSYSFGPTLGILKPYYLRVSSGQDGNGNLPIKYSTENAPIFLDKDRINGSSPFLTGVFESTFQPGANVKMGLHFDWGAYDEYVRALEVGVSADVFLKKIPIMVDNSQNRPFFINLYANLQFGKRK
jgi:hypothetical protein